MFSIRRVLCQPTLDRECYFQKGNLASLKKGLIYPAVWPRQDKSLPATFTECHGVTHLPSQPPSAKTIFFGTDTMPCLERYS